MHRDVKPANVMFTRDGRVKLTDFGVARIENSDMTQLGTVVGTPAYMSPEQFLGERVDWRVGIYANGVVLYQLLTGERRYEGSFATIMDKFLYTTATAVEPVPPGHAALDRIVAAPWRSGGRTGSTAPPRSTPLCSDWRWCRPCRRRACRSRAPLIPSGRVD